MKRHPSLVPLSREHHGALILARLLQVNTPPYKGLPGDTEGKASYALKFYNNELIAHFDKEEKVFKLLYSANDHIADLIKIVVQEHVQLHRLFDNLRFDNSTEMIQQLDTIGKVLEAHIRREERELFPAIEETFCEVTITEINRILSSH